MSPCDLLPPTFTPASILAWYIKLRPHTVQPDPTDTVLHQQVRFTPTQTKLRKFAASCDLGGSLCRD